MDKLKKFMKMIAKEEYLKFKISGELEDDRIYLEFDIINNKKGGKNGKK